MRWEPLKRAQLVSTAGRALRCAGDAATQRELRLQKVVERLKQRLEQYRAENEQLEEMLRVADAKAQGGCLGWSDFLCR